MTEFNKSWKSSKKPKKQRKYRQNAPKHIQGNFLKAHLSEELREKYDKRSLRLRKGDMVEIMRGDYKGEQGEVELIDTDEQKVYISNIEVTRRDGSKSKPPVKPSNLKITELNKDDPRRIEEVDTE